MPGVPAALEGAVEELADAATAPGEAVEPDPGIAPSARPTPLETAITPEEYDALRGGWGELDLPPEDGPASDGGGLPPGFADLPGDDAELLPDDEALDVHSGVSPEPTDEASGEDDDDQLPPGFSSPPSLVDA